MEKEKKTSKLAVITFIISIVSLLFVFTTIINFNFFWSILSLILLILLPLTLILSIISLVIIHKNDLKGKFFAIFSLVAAIVMIIIPILLVLLFVLSLAPKVYIGSCDSRPERVLRNCFIECSGDPYDYPRSECYYDKAARDKNISICDSLYESNLTYYNKDECYLKVNSNVHDLEICKKINNSETKEACFLEQAQFKNDINICAGLDVNNSEKCYEDAGFEKDPSLCDNISNISYKDYCYSGAERMQRDKSSFDTCDKIVNTNLQNECYSRAFAYTSSTCEKVSVKARDYCYFSLTVPMINGSAIFDICEKIININLKDKCYFNSAQFSKNLSVCEKVSENKQDWGGALVSSRDLCLIEVSDSPPYPPYPSWLDACDKITDTFTKDRCYSEAAISSENISTCEKISEQTSGQYSKDYCERYITNYRSHS